MVDARKDASEIVSFALEAGEAGEAERFAVIVEMESGVRGV